MNTDIIGPVDKVTNIVVDLGPQLIMVGEEVLGSADNISIEVAESTEEELEKLKSAHEIRLVKVGKEAKSARFRLKRCPHCHEKNPADTLICIHCHRPLK